MCSHQIGWLIPRYCSPDDGYEHVFSSGDRFRKGCFIDDDPFRIVDDEENSTLVVTVLGEILGDVLADLDV